MAPATPPDRTPEDATAAPGDPTTDGRRARGERNREAVVDAILSLIREGEQRPGAAAIAERAGVSMRSVFRHFEDIESLHEAAIARHIEQVGHLFELPATEGSQEDRITAFVDQRKALYEELDPIRVVSEQLRWRSAPINERLAVGRRLLRAQLPKVFAPEVDVLPAAERRELVDALEVATSWPTWHHLRLDQGLSAPRAATVMARMLRALLADAAA